MSDRKRAMCLRLSEDESDKLRRLAAELGMPQASIIRQWIREATIPLESHDEPMRFGRNRTPRMPEPEELIRMLRETFNIRRK